MVKVVLDIQEHKSMLMSYLNKIKLFALGLLFILIAAGCARTGKVSTKKLESNLGPYIYHYNGIQRRLYGDLESAIKLQKRSISLAPSNSAPYYELALCYGTLNQYDQAIPYLEKALTIDPDNKYYRYYLVILYINTNDVEKALESQRYLVQLDSMNLNYRLSYALLQSEVGNFDQSIELLNSISNDFGFVPQVADARVKIFFEKNMINEAGDEIKDLLSSQPDVALYRMYESEYLFRIGEDSAGFAALDKALQLEPQNGFVKINKYLRMRESGMLSESFNLLHEIFIDTSIIAKDKSDLFFPLIFDPTTYGKQLPQVDTIVNKLAQLYPNDLKIQEYFFEHQINKKEFVKARKVLTRVLELDIENPKTWERVITFDFSFGNPESAIVYAQRASRKFPEISIFYILKAIALDTIDETELAIETLIEGSNNVKNDEIGKAEIYGTIADFHYKKSSQKLAFEYYQKALVHDKYNTRVLNNYSYYLSLNKQNLPKALEMSTKAVDLEPNNSTYIDTKGWVLFQMERYEEAKEVLRNAISKSGSSSAVITEHYADALFMTGNKESAIIYWIKARELGGESEKLIKKIETKSYIP